MKEEIWKFPIPIKDNVVIEMPACAKILTVQAQQGIAMMWAICNPIAENESRLFSVVGTGQSFNFSDHYYIGTFQLDSGALIFHVFEYRP